MRRRPDFTDVIHEQLEEQAPTDSEWGRLEQLARSSQVDGLRERMERESREARWLAEQMKVKTS